MKPLTSLQHGLLPFLALALPSVGLAQVTPIGPFTGDRSESFETQNHSGFQACVIDRIFGGTADLCTVSGNAQLLLSSSWGFMCSIQAHTGNRFTGSAGDPVVFTFDSDIEAFGGYFGTNSWSVGSAETVTVRFFDRQGNMIDSVLADVADDCTWRWNGWSAPGIASIEVENSAFSGGFVDMDSLEVLDSSGAGTTYCNSATNSTGAEATLAGSGSGSLGLNNLVLETTQLPQNSFAFYLAGQTAAMTPSPGGSQGTLCLGGAIGRYVGPGQIQNSGSTGTVSLPIDLTSIPQPTGAVSASAGQTWRFQTWYRDANPTATSNFSSAIEVAITP